MKRDVPSPDSAAGTDEVPAQRTFPVSRWRHGVLTTEVDHLAEEVPVALEFNGISHAVMLATPADLEDFALGFSLSEGIVAAASDIYGVDVEASGQGITVKVEIATCAFVALKGRRRAMAGRTGCGLCGTESLDEVMRMPEPVQSQAEFDPGVFEHAFAVLHKRQALLRDTGATHAAAWMRADGEIALVREDVGRHNALDKLAGALARGGQEDIARGAVIVTSRASYEMVQKTAAIGAGVLAAVSGPTAMAVRLAQTAGITLAGFVRGGTMVVYSHPQRLHIG
ncbi:MULTISPECIES: formate dehydrogenase accessory sulfurtransferase FdhD [unclassified Cupriavidus]|uniref:formate dehydrogenase accessory sulfurtransferase FdhD n=1 Tax=unclassified Cupriavidus TaxID=2640874 RepID=UPI001C007573|nr:MULTISPECIES: formate dehydrogenase accessory sulfurtransferase FdhD [unclassified Cupriavidus]MCA3192548.1 formate dehydrogenase accessory sulfurtransferase FdhD [Cupriavidus sp.]MCA3200079.1 formate dehydrogenase accessory sulfurtransferase FdhD [Cupriavidus sp.]MCA3203498.1 formate dehydrogenase accessory sulfurtransferase FdhD [Cupriavidus sp.]MCA3208826.1 formate dehydrogenase accessory sulfurtransferase FdhD [Cupriavidus sp.]QWE94937.1 formate dehydrogenase accessory sulfurtransferase